MWVARDKNGKLFAYKNEPYKESFVWTDEEIWEESGLYLEVDSNLFPEVKWEDEQPRKVKLVLED